MEIRVRQMAKEDAKVAAMVEATCFSDPWSEEAFEATLLLPYAYYEVIEVQEEDLSYHVVGMNGIRMIYGEGEITNVAILPEYRGQGLSTVMLTHLIEEATKRGTAAFTLEVRAGNEPAIALYTHLGFEVEGVRPNFYEHPAEDALIMWKRR